MQASGAQAAPQAPLLGVAVNPFLTQPLWEEQQPAASADPAG